MATRPADARGATLFDTRAAAVAAFAVVFVGVLTYFARERLLAIVTLLLTDGLILAAYVAGAAACGHELLRLARVRAGGMFGFVTAAALGLGLFALLTLGLGLAGLLNQATAVAFPVAAALPWIARHARRGKIDLGQTVRPWLAAPAGWGWLWVLAAPSLALALAGGSIIPGILWKPDDPHPYDVTTYHLLVPREWWELGRIVPTPHNPYGYFPFNAEMGYLWAMHVRGGPWAGMYLAQFTSLAYAVLAVLAVYAACRARGGTVAAATAAGVVVATMPWVVMSACVAYVEPMLLMFGAVCLGWVVAVLPPRVAFERDEEHSHGAAQPPLEPGPSGPGWSAPHDPGPDGPGSRGGEEAREVVKALTLAGAFAGFAIGTKLTAGPMLLAAVPVALLVVAAVVRRLTRRLVVGCVAFGVVGLLVASPWLVRNAVWTGNPFFPNAMPVLGRGHLTAAQVERYEVAHAAPAAKRSPGARLAAAGDELALGWQFGYVLWPLTVAALLVNPRRPAAWALAGVVLVQLAFWVGFTHLIGRFFVLAVPAAAIVVGTTRWRRGGEVAIGIAVALAVVVAWAGAPGGAGGLMGRFERFAAMGRFGLFGIDDLGFLVPQAVERIERRGETVHLVGDAQAFLHPGPIAHVKYRTIFAVAGGEADVVKAWTGRRLDELGPDEWVLIDPPEIDRLARTYRHIPPLTGAMRKAEVPFLMDRNGRVVLPQR